MKAVIQRVASASVSVDEALISQIGKGVLVLAGISDKDTRKEVESMASKILKMKMWPDDDGVNWRNSVQDIDGEVLCVSQFTLQASTKKGNKPDFHSAAKGEKARELYDHFFCKVQELHGSSKVKNGVFQAMMEVTSQNSGPVSVNYLSHEGAVTLEIETKPPEDKNDLGKDTSKASSSKPQEAAVSGNNSTSLNGGNEHQDA